MMSSNSMLTGTSRAARAEKRDAQALGAVAPQWPDIHKLLGLSQFQAQGLIAQGQAHSFEKLIKADHARAAFAELIRGKAPSQGENREDQAGIINAVIQFSAFAVIGDSQAGGVLGGLGQFLGALELAVVYPRRRKDRGGPEI